MTTRRAVMRFPQRTVNRRVAKLTKKMAKISVPEINNHFLATSNTVSTSDGDQHFSIMDVAQGDGNQQRVGDWIKPKSVDIFVRLKAGSNTEGGAIRFILIRSKRRFLPVGNSTADATQVLQSAGTVTATVSSYSKGNRHHYEVLYDRTHYVGNVGTSTAGKTFHIRKRLHGKVQYLADSTTLFESGKITLLVIGDRTTAQANGVKFEMNTHFKWTE